MFSQLIKIFIIGCFISSLTHGSENKAKVSVKKIGDYITEATITNNKEKLTIVAKRLTPSKTDYPTAEDDPIQLLQRLHLIWVLQDPDCMAIIGDLIKIKVSAVAGNYFKEIPAMPNNPLLKQRLIELAKKISIYANPKAMDKYLDGVPRNTVDTLLRVVEFFGPLSTNRKWVEEQDPRSGFMLYKDGQFAGYTYITSLDALPGCGIFLVIIHPNFQNLGIGNLAADFMINTYAPQVFKQSKPVYSGKPLKTIKVTSNPDNERWIKIAIKYGFLIFPLEKNAPEIEVSLKADGSLNTAAIAERAIKAFKVNGKIKDGMTQKEIDKVLDSENFYMTYKGTKWTYQLVKYWGSPYILKQTFYKPLS